MIFAWFFYKNTNGGVDTKKFDVKLKYKLINFTEQSPSEKLTVIQPVKEFSTFYGTQAFTFVFTRAKLSNYKNAITIGFMFSLYWKVW